MLKNTKETLGLNWRERGTGRETGKQHMELTEYLWAAPEATEDGVVEYGNTPISINKETGKAGLSFLKKNIDKLKS